MEKNENKVLLTPELYEKISGDKVNKITALKKFRALLTGRIEEEENALDELYAQKAEIEAKIRVTNANLSAIRSKRFKTVRELGKQKRLANKINKLATKEEKYIEVEKFYPEEQPKKR